MHLISIRFAVRKAVIYMLTIRAGMRKSFETLWTLKWLLPGMKPFVFGKVMLVLESLVTVRTFIRTKICKEILSVINIFIYIYIHLLCVLADGRQYNFLPECSYLCLVIELFFVKVLSHRSQ